MALKGCYNMHRKVLPADGQPPVLVRSNRAPLANWGGCFLSFHQLNKQVDDADDHKTESKYFHRRHGQPPFLKQGGKKLPL